MNIEEIVDNFGLFDDWEDKYTYLIDLGRALPPMDAGLKTEETRVKGCISKIWMVLGWDENGRLSLTADSDAQIAKGLVAVLYAAFQGRTPEEAAAVDIDAIFGRMGLDRYLTPNRRNGFYSMVERIRAFTAGCR
ncbi:MAG: SufE family protein [Alphaproteobacteria bacterium]|nr:SufE family protein [Alphaproteobacteria bacterium]MDE2335692.1 SufE family protein [Alphaproteobacteria bacterium]